MVVKNVNTIQEFNQMLLDPTYKSTIVNFTAKWCGPCQMIKPYYEQLSKIYQTVQFLRVDVDKLPDISNWANVRAMPTFTMFKSGVKVMESVGVDQNVLNDMLKKFS